MNKTLSKILGGLYGQALGDAWAMPAHLHPDDTWEAYNGWIETFEEPPAGHPAHDGLPAGRITDDTEQAFAIAEVMIEEKQVTPEGVAKAIILWYDRVNGDTNPYVGPSTRRAVLALKAGKDIMTTGSFGDTDGAAMRISPIGLIHPGDVEGAILDAYRSCIPTHRTGVAISGAAAVAASIAVAMQENSTLDEIIEAGIAAGEEGRKLGNRWMGASIPKRIKIAVDIARSDSPIRDRIQELYDIIGTGLAMSEAVPAAYGALVLGEGDPKQTAIYAAAMSGDADTVAAMACAIAGAWKGVEVFEQEIIDTLKKVNPELDFETTAQGLFELIKA
ncbi:MAG: ADP-ribosylglycohydrolase family protein [Anaerolineaceae bacterium]|nr:ADP-ribosylglycohydrolase family protein [Anaerolineaceae bacterium]